jgi:hypothetical protein
MSRRDLSSNEDPFAFGCVRDGWDKKPISGVVLYARCGACYNYCTVRELVAADG